MTLCRLRLMIIVIFLIIRSSASSVKLLPDTQAYQVVPCFRTIFRPIWHVDYGGDQTLAHVFRDMHDVEAMRRAEKLPVWQLPENRPCFPYLHQRLVLLLPLSLLSSFSATLPLLRCSYALGFLGSLICHRTGLHVFSMDHSCRATSDAP